MANDRVFLILAEAEHGRRYRELAESLFASRGSVVHVDWARDLPWADRERAFLEQLPTADALVTSPWLGPAPGLEMPSLDARRWASATKLRVVAGTYDFRLGWVDLAEARLHGVQIIDTSRTMTPTVAEFGVAMTLNLLRRIPEAIEVVRAGEWLPGAMDGSGHVYGDLAGRRVGLVGYGSINRHYRRYISGFGCHVTAFDPFVDEATFDREAVASAATLVELARGAEILVVAVPPTPATRGLVNGEVINSLPAGALFVLLSRMAVVEQESLWRRVRAGELRVAVDVFDPEPPPPEAWFRRAPNVLPTPHIAGNTGFAHERCFLAACSDVINVIEGGIPLHAATQRDKQLYDGSAFDGQVRV